MAFLIALLITLAVSAVMVIVRALILSYPAMLLFGAIHSWYPVVPAFGYAQTLGIILLLSLLIPVSTSVKND